MSIIPEDQLQSSSPHMKASEYPDFNRTMKVVSAGPDELQYPGEPVKHGYIVQFEGAPKAIWLSKSNLKAMVKVFGNDTDAWAGKQVLLTVKNYDIEGKKTIGWITTPIAEGSAADAFDDKIPF
ncbi:MAG: hypothetical protein GY918_13050 [Gammaproteobacteria bacterium]|nr:hypothetical protein [Gammaproteobacteria bacterium]